MQLNEIEYIHGVPKKPERIIEFWRQNGITITKTDNPDSIRETASLYPRLFITAYATPKNGAPEQLGDPRIAADEGEIIGTVWGNFDGRRGYIVHLAVNAELRTQGIGRRLMNLVEGEFRKMGCYKIHLFVEEHNSSVANFYTHLGYKERTDLTVFSKTL